jgi:tryptophan synthase beta subunit
MEARNLSQSLNNALGTTGVRIWLKREDLCTTGSHCANSAFGQALLARKLGFDRVIVPTGNGQMGVAAAAACASLNLSCEVHMAGSGISL